MKHGNTHGKQSPVNFFQACSDKEQTRETGTQANVMGCEGQNHLFTAMKHTVLLLVSALQRKLQ